MGPSPLALLTKAGSIPKDDQLYRQEMLAEMHTALISAHEAGVTPKAHSHDFLGGMPYVTIQTEIGAITVSLAPKIDEINPRRLSVALKKGSETYAVTLTIHSGIASPSNAWLFDAAIKLCGFGARIETTNPTIPNAAAEHLINQLLGWGHSLYQRHRWNISEHWMIYVRARTMWSAPALMIVDNTGAQAPNISDPDLPPPAAHGLQINHPEDSLLITPLSVRIDPNADPVQVLRAIAAYRS